MLKRNEEDLKLQKFKKEKSRKINKKVFKRIILGLVSLLLICTLYSLFTPISENVLVSGARKVLASVGVYTEEVKKVEIKSDGYTKQEGGSWHIDKSADWIGLNKAQIKFELDTVVKTGDHLKDVVFVLDISGSMSGDKLGRVKSDTIELINYLLSNSNNRVALITFDSSSTILSEFTNDKEKLIELVDGLQTKGATNYNIALSNVDKVLEGYTRENNRDLVTLFLTDGYPCEDTPNQIATYKVLKDKYPYMVMNGIQYEMGKAILEDIINISDNQFIANMESLNNVLFEASIAPEYYESFEIVDYIDKDYWYVEDVSYIKVKKGHVRLEEENGVQKVVWSFNNEELRTGESVNMTIDVKLKEQYVGTKGFYPTNEKETINYKLPEEDEVKDTSSKTPVLKSWYDVIYDANTPSNCTIDENYREDHFMFETVTKRNDKLTCDGYIFNGWEIVNQGVKQVNDDVFIMPSDDVTIRGVWTKPVIAKSMEGEVRERLTLYKQVQEDVNDSTKYARKYTGLTDTFLGDKDIYYYYDSLANNNVIFGNYCWKIVRTTDTGGVKLLYNGVPSKAGICSGNFESITKSVFNLVSSSPSDVGYMYNTRYTYRWKNPSPEEVITMLNKSTMSSSTSYNYYYSDTYKYENGKYYLYTDDNPDSVVQTPWIETITDEEGNSKIINNYENLEGKYTCRNNSTSIISKNDTGRYCSSLYYVVRAESGRMYYITLSNGNDLDASRKITLSRDIDTNDDGTYTLATPIEVDKLSWYTDYSSYKGYYTCGDNALTCSAMEYISSTNKTSITYLDISKNYKYGNSFTYDSDTGQYTLIDTDVSTVKRVWNFANEYSTLKNNHYTCWNIEGICSSISYIYFVKDESSYYIDITDGKSVEDALNEMLYNDDVNKYDSAIKKVIDNWYANNMTDYTEYLEDTYWCNDRSISNLGGWNPNGGSLSVALSFGSSGLICPNKNDRFTVESENGNGKLTYPVGLITRRERSLDGRLPGSYWTISPKSFTRYAFGLYIEAAGYESLNSVTESAQVRPSISLRAGIDYFQGDGSVDNPYIIDTKS